MRWGLAAIIGAAAALAAMPALAAGERLSSAPLKATEFHDAGLKADSGTPPVEAAPTDQPDSVSKFGSQVYRALTDGDPSAYAGFIRDAINSLGGICPNVKAFQRVGPKSKLLTYKVRCGKRPLYLLTVDEVGRMLVDGGDGRVPAMLAGDGEVMDSTGESIEGDKAVKNGKKVDDEIPLDEVAKAGPVAASSVGAAAHPQKWLKLVAIIVVAASLFAAIALFLRFNASNGAAPRASSAPRRYPSELKDAMIAESQEVLPDMWLHDSGVYIIRGRHGKRRVFAYRWNAMIYYRWGYKILQLR